MDIKRTSHEFHRRLESPSAFLRREWKTAAVCGGAFGIALLAAVFLIDPAFFYPRMQTDPLNYYLKAKWLVESGSTSALWAVNQEPFAYVSMPGILRAPFILVFPDFDDQLLGMQVANIAIVGCVALMSAYIFSWTLPVARRWMAIAFAFAFTAVSPVWMANIFLPLADGPYAVCTLAVLLVSVELFCSEKRISSRPLLVVFLAALFTFSFLFRFTAPVLLAFIIPLGRARWKHDTIRTRAKWLITLGALVSVAILVAFNSDAILGRYLWEPLSFLRRGEKVGMMINLFGAGFPTQIIPTFQLGFIHPPIIALYRTSFLDSPVNAAWAAVGILIASVIISGIWYSRRRFLPEILYLAAGLPVIGLMMPSTTRYLMSYQPLFWIFFYVGASTLATRYAPWVVRLVKSPVAAIGMVGAVAAAVVGLRAWKVAGSASEKRFAVSVDRVPEYVAEVSTTFRELRQYLDSLPKDRTLVIGAKGTVGRWKAISDLDYYYPDSALTAAVKAREVYLLLECGTQDGCVHWDYSKKQAQDSLLHFGSFEFDSVFAAQSGRARAEVLRLRESY